MVFKSIANGHFLSLLASANIINPCLAKAIANISDIDAHLLSLKPSFFPDLETISRDIYNNPELGGSEFFAHSSTVNYFQNNRSGEWTVFPNLIPSLPTAWKIEFSHVPANWARDQPIPTVGFMSEFDALPIEVGTQLGHSCGHHLIWLQGVYAASLARQALIDYDIPGRVVVVGSPDEEQSAGKFALEQAGIFDISQVWLMSHPTIANAIQPMSARQNIIVKVIKDTHFDAVKTAYNMLVPLANITTLPGEFSTAALIEDTGFFVCNVVQADIALGVVGRGATIASVTDTINTIKTAHPGFASTNFTLVEDLNIAGGVQILFTGNAGHASQANLGAMTLSIATFQALNATNGDFQFYLPDNTTIAELDFTVDARTRWTSDMETVVDFVLDLIPTKNFSLDIMYPAYEPDPKLGPLFIDTIGLPEYGAQNWSISKTPPAATDASWVQQAQVLAKNGNHTLQSVEKAVLHANFNVCEQPVAQCPFNHDPPFALIAGTDHAYDQTEKTSRAIARIAVQLLNDPTMMSDVTSNIRTGPAPVWR
jgi:metal-dependent amidase/aminoacylase/carboxypeptidase family protein